MAAAAAAARTGKTLLSRLLLPTSSSSILLLSRSSPFLSSNPNHNFFSHCPRSTILTSSSSSSSPFSKPLIHPWHFFAPKIQLQLLHAAQIHSLTDTRFPKRRPGLKPRRKRASLRPRGPYAWVKYVPGEPIAANQPNEGSVKGRKRRKKARLRREFILSEAKKRRGEMQAARQRKQRERVERKMAAVARERAWAERLVELQKAEAEAATEEDNKNRKNLPI